jgi:hypothetical protein
LSSTYHRFAGFQFIFVLVADDLLEPAIWAPMDFQTRIRKIIESTNCSYDVAQAADEEASGDLPKAMEIARRKMNLLFAGGRSGQYMRETEPRKHVTQYKNGILVEDKFYDFSVDDNMRLKKMLEKKTFDASILGEEGETAEVIYSEKLDEEYNIPGSSPKAKRSDFVGVGKKLGKSRCLDIDIPDTIALAEDGDAIFKVIVGNRRTTVKMQGTRPVGEFLEYMRRYCNEDLKLMMNDAEVLPDCQASVLANETAVLGKR